MCRLLQSCQALENFHWTVTCPGSWNPQLNLVFTDVWPEILYFGHCLKLLALYKERCICKYMCTSSHIGTYDSLQQLEELQSLTLEESGRMGEVDIDDQDPTVEHDLQELPMHLQDFVYISSDYGSADCFIDELVLACQTRSAMRVELCGLDSFDATYMARLAAKYPGFQFRFSTRCDRGPAKYCILIQQKGRQETKSAADEYDAIIAAAYAPYAGQTPRSRPYGNDRSCEVKLQPGLLTPKCVP